jgi:two-component system NtrC family sensor kinase
MKKSYQKTEEKLTSEGAELRQSVAEIETECKQVEEKLQAILKTALDGFWLTNLEGKLLEVNDSYCKMVGYRREELLNMYISDLEAIENPQEVTQHIKRILEQGRHRFESRHKRKDGQIIDVEVSVNYLDVGEGQLFVSARDITEHKQAEKALIESQKFSSSLLETLPNPMLVVNPDTSLKYVNPAFERLTSFTLAEIRGLKAPHPWWPEEYKKEMLAGLKAAMAIGGRKSERIFQKKNGERFWVAQNSAAVVHNGELIHFLVNWVDITERKQAEEREKELQKELYLSSRLASIGELAAGVAHQLNNPLTGVLGFSQRLLRKSTDQETNQDLKRIYAEAERAAKVVQNLLTFARRRQPHKQYSDINEMIESALELRVYEMKTSNIEVVTHLAPNLPQTMLDFYQIQEVFLNIILNAEQAMTEASGDGKIIIKTEKNKGYIRISFIDNGPGIPAGKLYKIFDPFYTTKGEEKGGTGLGLSVCHGIITEHGGKIYAKSKPGKGTTFFVELPLGDN